MYIYQNVIIFSEIVSLEKKRLRWEDTHIPFDGTPFVVLGTEVRECHQGPDRHVKDKSKYRAKQVNNTLFKPIS